MKYLKHIKITILLLIALLIGITVASLIYNSDVYSPWWAHVLVVIGAILLHNGRGYSYNGRATNSLRQLNKRSMSPNHLDFFPFFSTHNFISVASKDPASTDTINGVITTLNCITDNKHSSIRSSHL